MSLFNLCKNSFLSLMIKVQLILFISLGVPYVGFAQGYLKTEYVTSSSLTEYDTGNKFGSGDLLKVSGMYNFSFFNKLNDRKQITSWSMAIHGAYGVMNNREEAIKLNPHKIINLGANINYLHPISKKWSLLVTIGAGIYASPDQITGKSILINGGVIFIRNIKDNLRFGIGVGLTNSYGVPLILPMSIFNWNLSGKYEVSVNLSNGIEVNGGVKFGDKFKLKLQAIETDGMSSVMNINGKSMIYSTIIMRSYLRPEYKISNSSILYLGAGATWFRGTGLTERSIKEFFKAFGGDNQQLDFAGAGYFTVGFCYGF